LGESGPCPIGCATTAAESRRMGALLVSAPTDHHAPQRRTDRNEPLRSSRRMRTSNALSANEEL